MNESYLNDCFQQFSDVSKQRWEHSSDLTALEEAVKALRTGEVSVQNLLECLNQHFKNTRHWWFDKYWLIPSLEQLSKEEQNRTFIFHQLSRGNENKPQEETVIKNLLGVFRQIELVSIILRFICPDSFGILSPPVEHVLALRRGKNATETYLNYLRNLREIRDQYEFDTAAASDMALWVLEHRCYDEKLKDLEIKGAFEKDEFMLRLRAKNLVEPLRDLSPAWRTTAFHNIDDDLTVLIGCYALEKYVKELASVENVEKAREKEPTLEHRIKALDKEGKLPFLSLGRGELDYLRALRNKVFHGEEISGIEKKQVS